MTEGRTREPQYHVSTFVGGRVVGAFRQPIPDPFVRQTVTVGWRDLLRGLLRRRLIVEVQVGGDTKDVERVLELNPDFLGGPNSPSRKAWNAAINERLATLGNAEPGCDPGRVCWLDAEGPRDLCAAHLADFRAWQATRQFADGTAS